MRCRVFKSEQIIWCVWCKKRTHNSLQKLQCMAVSVLVQDRWIFAGDFFHLEIYLYRGRTVSPGGEWCLFNFFAPFPRRRKTRNISASYFHPHLPVTKQAQEWMSREGAYILKSVPGEICHLLKAIELLYTMMNIKAFYQHLGRGKKSDIWKWESLKLIWSDPLLNHEEVT